MTSSLNDKPQQQSVDELEKIIVEYFNDSHEDNDYETCASCYLVSPAKRRTVYFMNATPRQKREYQQQPCDCGVDKRTSEAKAAIQKLLDEAVLAGKIAEYKKNRRWFERMAEYADVKEDAMAEYDDKIYQLEAELKALQEGK